MYTVKKIIVFPVPNRYVINYLWVGNTKTFSLHGIEAKMNFKLFRLLLCVSLSTLSHIPSLHFFGLWF
jgi:hypothetical protein